MFIIHLKALKIAVEKAHRRKITLKEIATNSGCDKNALSRIVNVPDSIPSLKVVEQLVIYFSKELQITPEAALNNLLTIRY